MQHTANKEQAYVAMFDRRMTDPDDILDRAMKEGHLSAKAIPAHPKWDLGMPLPEEHAHKPGPKFEWDKSRPTQELHHHHAPPTDVDGRHRFFMELYNSSVQDAYDSRYTPAGATMPENVDLSKINVAQGEEEVRATAPIHKGLPTVFDEHPSSAAGADYVPMQMPPSKPGLLARRSAVAVMQPSKVPSGQYLQAKERFNQLFTAPKGSTAYAQGSIPDVADHL